MGRIAKDMLYKEKQNFESCIQAQKSITDAESKFRSLLRR